MFRLLVVVALKKKKTNIIRWQLIGTVQLQMGNIIRWEWDLEVYSFTLSIVNG